MQKKKSKEAPHLRENYEDHRLRFLNWVHRSGIERSWLGRLVMFLEERLQLRRFSFFLIFSVVLAILINFSFETSSDYEVGDVARSDYNSPLTFEMVDEITTEEKRLKAESAVPLIFDYDPLVFERVSSSVYRSFRLMRTEARKVRWPVGTAAREEAIKEFNVHKGQFEAELGVQVPDYLFEWITERGFSVRVENLVIRHLNAWSNLKIVESVERAVPVARGTVTARPLQRGLSGREFQLRRNELVDLANLEAFAALAPEKRKLSEQDRANVLALARLLVVPNLTLNKGEMATRKEMARAQVLPITVSIKRNQTILDSGTVVQPYHMAILSEIQALRSDRRQYLVVLAMSLLFLAIILVFSQYVKRFTSANVKLDAKDMAVMGVVTLGMVLLTKLFWFTTEAAIVSKFGAWIPASLFLFLAPVASGPMLIGLVIQSGEVVWLFTVFLAIVMGVLSEANFVFLLVTFAGGIAAARGVFNCKERNDIYWAGVRAGAVNALVIALALTITRMDQPEFAKELMFSVPAGFLSGIFSALIAMMLIPALESVFHYTTDVKLLELSNLNHPLLKEMIVRAPGTYHHSMMVGSMVEAAAEEIQANPLLGKVMCYYHDIGKMEHSNYFIENQKPGQNPHDHISPYMSKTLLIAHVKDGVERGMAFGLGQPIIDGILQHHGTTLISFFYNKALDQKEEDQADVGEEDFRYPGPKPQFREAALCMLADSIEAAARSLDEPTPVRLQNIVRNIVQRKFMDGQLDECNLSLRDLSKVEMAFSRILMGIYHQRIDYPKSAGGGAAEPVQKLFAASVGKGVNS